MLTKWVGQAWRELHANQGELIRQRFRKLGLSFAVNGSEDAELSIRDLAGIVVGDWKFTSGQINEPQIKDAIEVDESTVKVDEASKPGADAGYVFDGDNGAENEDQAGDRNSGSELEDNDRGEGDMKSDDNE